MLTVSIVLLVLGLALMVLAYVLAKKDHLNTAVASVFLGAFGLIAGWLLFGAELDQYATNKCNDKGGVYIDNTCVKGDFIQI